MIVPTSVPNATDRNKVMNDVSAAVFSGLNEVHIVIYLCRFYHLFTRLTFLLAHVMRYTRYNFLSDFRKVSDFLMSTLLSFANSNWSPRCSYNLAEIVVRYLLSSIIILHISTSRRVWTYQRGNQKPYIEEEQTTQWPKEKVQKD